MGVGFVQQTRDPFGLCSGTQSCDQPISDASRDRPAPQKCHTICFTFTKRSKFLFNIFTQETPQAAKGALWPPDFFQQIHGYTMNLSYCDAKNSSLESPQKNFRASLENRKGWMGRWYQQSRETVGLFCIPWNICLSEILVSHIHRISSNLDFKSCRAHVEFISPAWWHSTWGQCFDLRMKHLYCLGHVTVTHEILNTCWP